MKNKFHCRQISLLLWPSQPGLPNLSFFFPFLQKSWFFAARKVQSIKMVSKRGLAILTDTLKMTRSLAAYFGMIWKHLTICEPDHVFIISFSEKDSVLKACCDLGTCCSQKGSVVKQRVRGSGLLTLPLSFPLGFFSQSLRCVFCVHVWGRWMGWKWQIVLVSGSLIKQKKHVLLFIYYLGSQGHPWVPSTQPLFPHHRIWLPGWCSLACVQRGSWVSLAIDKLWVAPSLQDPFSLVHLWPSHWLVFSPFGCFFLHLFFMKTLCVSDRPLTTTNNNKKEDKANEFFVWISCDSVSYIWELLMAKAGL